MHRIVLSSGILAMVFAAAPAARADFRLGPSPDGAAAAARSGPSALSGNGLVEISPFKIARGFGRAIPLSFAVRQIVPAAVAIRYGPGVDQSRLVNWSGDAPWNRVLEAAMHPLGLRVVTGELSVLIAR